MSIPGLRMYDVYGGLLYLFFYSHYVTVLVCYVYSFTACMLGTILCMTFKKIIYLSTN